MRGFRLFACAVVLLGGVQFTGGPTQAAVTGKNASFITFDVPGATGGNGYGTFPSAIDPGRGTALVGLWENTNNGGWFLRTSNGTITPIKPPGSIWSVLDSTINAAGTIAGFYLNAHSETRGYLRSRSGRFTVFAMPHGANVFTQAPAINIKGEMTGYYQDGRKLLAFLRDPDGTFTRFSAPRATAGTFPLSINAEGRIAGYYVVPVSTGISFHGFTRTPDGTLTTYDAPAAAATFLDSINDKGDIAGNYYDAKGTSHGFLLTANGSFSQFDAPGAGAGQIGQGTFVVETNPSADITGYYTKSGSSISHGYLRSRDGTITTFDFPGAGNATPVGINANCVIAGSYSDRKGTSHGFLRTPASRSCN